ncbi:class I SAM-dependent methyltransferase [Maribacter litoralis]|uniref:class I SAM-dependent methyltransferase n=1 Tax=Maribacter litoralis TaxID=2059726 RepID=UPI000E311748|nr:class I SAM-dependent methyltransferase [Maribacter litoralis]
MTKTKTYLKTKDYLVTKEHFHLEYDSEKDMLITQPIPTDITKYYDSNNYISHTDESKSLLEKVYQIVKQITLSQKVKLINKYSQEQKTILDIGCGTGEFLSTAKTVNWNTIGVELSTQAREIAIKKNLTIYKSLKSITNQKFNIITLWHVLEHLPNLDKQINLIENLLEENGTLIIAVPNYKSYDAQYYRQYWAAYDTPRHLWHFSKTSITIIFKEHNLSVKKILPMYFDSYYVSLLSEKYKKGYSNYFMAFYRGLVSNIKAKQSGEYSSHIYILQKD